MVFSSLEFLCVFLPVTFIIYSIVPNLKVKNAILILASLFFYAYGEPVYVLLMLASVCVNYLTARGITANEQHKKLILIVGIVFNVGALGIFKYLGFLIETVDSIFSANILVPGFALPIGISFYTFQAMSYIIDVYRGDVPAQKNFFNVLLYISFFPQLIAGPIVRYQQIYKAIEDRKQSVDMVMQGLQRFTFGLGKKVLIANTMGAVADAIYAADAADINMLTAWIGAVAYLFQIYYDFSGYSDMAIGLGKMFGFHFEENFNYPYGSRNMQEFWHRWHISLTSWFREYVYIPLGGNRKGKTRTSVNKMIVFLLTGLWHGASWTFVIWGVWHGFFQLLEDYIPALKKLPRVLGHIYTLLVVTVGFVIFRADTFSQGLFFLREMFTGVTMTRGALSLALQQATPWVLFIAVIAVIGAAPIKPLADRIRKAVASVTADEETDTEDADTEDTDAEEETITAAEETKEPKAEKAGEWQKAGKVLQVCLCAASVFILCWCILRLSGSTYNPFIYFRF